MPLDKTSLELLLWWITVFLAGGMAFGCFMHQEVLKRFMPLLGALFGFKDDPDIGPIMRSPKLYRMYNVGMVLALAGIVASLILVFYPPIPFGVYVTGVVTNAIL